MDRKIIHIRNKARFTVKGGGRPRTPGMCPWVHQYLLTKHRTGDYVFLNRKGEKIIGASITHQFKNYIRKAKLSDGLHFHSLRHTGISYLANLGVPLQVIQRMAGHLTPSVTDNIYTHFEEKTLLAAMSAFSNFTLN